jgi:hypothetical protein
MLKRLRRFGERSDGLATEREVATGDLVGDEYFVAAPASRLAPTAGDRICRPRALLKMPERNRRSELMVGGGRLGNVS